MSVPGPMPSTKRPSLRNLTAACALVLVSGLACAHAEDSPIRAQPTTREVSFQATHDALATGDLAAARTAVDALVAECRCAPALVFRVCVALEAGDYAQAERDLATLRQTAAEAPEVVLLARLASIRATQPQLAWSDALIDAWVFAGRPDLQQSKLLPPESVEQQVTECGAEAAVPEVRLAQLLSRPLNDERARDLAALLPEFRAREPALWRAGFARLSESKGISASMQAETREALRREIATAASEHPDDMQLQILAITSAQAAGAALTAGQVADLDQASQLSRFRAVDLSRAFFDSRHVLRAAGRANPDDEAFGLFVDALGSVFDVLTRENDGGPREPVASEDPIRLAEAIWRIGSKQAQEPTLVDALVGGSLMKIAASKLDDQEMLTLVEEHYQRAKEALVASGRLSVHRFPLPSLRRDWVERLVQDELALLSKLPVPAPSAP